MSDNVRPDQYDRIQTRFDEALRVIRLWEIQLEQPIPNISDAPKRCYSINDDWAVLILGWLSILETVVVWRDANDETFDAIQQITELLEGTDCMDCTDIANCPEIVDLINRMNGAENDIAANTADIAANTADIAANTADIAANTADIATQAIQIQTNTDDIADNLISIQQHEITLQSHTTQINNNVVTLNNHETRIQALEAGSGGSASYIKTLAYVVDVVTDQQTASTIYGNVPNASIIHQFTKTNALIIATVLAQKTSSYQSETNFRLLIGTDIYGLNEVECSEAGLNTVFVSETFTNLPVGLNQITLQWKVDSGFLEIRDKRDITYTIIEYDSVVLPSDYLVDFSPTSWGYASGVGDSGVYSASGGNPAECWYGQGIGNGQGLVVEIDDIAETTIYNVKMDVLVTPDGVAGPAAYVQCFVRIGGATVASYNLPQSMFGAFVNVDLAIAQPAQFPYAHTPTDLIEIVVYSFVNVNVALTLDNVIIDATA